MLNRPKYYKFVMTSLFIAIIFILAFTPFGYIHLGVIKATIIHVPVIMGSILLGPKIGAVLGTTFGLSSLIINTISPSLLSFAFSPFIPLPGTDTVTWFALVICFLPRILVGVIPYYVYKGLYKTLKKNKKSMAISLFISGIVGSAVNSVLVMSLMYFISGVKDFSLNAAYGSLMVIIAINAVPEAIFAGIVVTALGSVLIKAQNNNW